MREPADWNVCLVTCGYRQQNKTGDTEEGMIILVLFLSMSAKIKARKTGLMDVLMIGCMECSISAMNLLECVSTILWLCYFDVMIWRCAD